MAENTSPPALDPIAVADFHNVLKRSQTDSRGINRLWKGQDVMQVARPAGFQDDAKPIDICLVIGISAQVWPAAGYAELARRKGARVAVINTDAADAAKNARLEKDWIFVGDAAVVVPELLKPVIGECDATI